LLRRTTLPERINQVPRKVSMKSFAAIAAAILTLVMPGAASADAGAISGVAPAGNGQVTATYTATFSQCTSSGYCGWFPQASQVPASSPCPAAIEDTHITYVGTNQDTSGTQTGTDTFYPAYPSTRLCLYAYHDSRDFLLADYVYPSVTAPTGPTPTQPAGGGTATVGPISISEAKGYVPAVLKKKFGRRFNRNSLMRSCYRLTGEKVRCRVAWRKFGTRWSGSVTIWNDPRDPAHRYLYRLSVRPGG
jgi:hypothetical protein